MYEQNGEVWLEKRIEEYVLQSADVTLLNTTAGTVLDFAEVSISNMTGVKTISTHLIDGSFYVEGKTETEGTVSVWDFIGNNNKWGKRTAEQVLQFFFPIDTYANLAAAQAAFAGTVVQYELATPQLINLTEQGLADGQLTAYANGTVYNTSQTFHADINFDVASNRSAQISALIDNSDYQANLIDSKASITDLGYKSIKNWSGNLTGSSLTIPVTENALGKTIMITAIFDPAPYFYNYSLIGKATTSNPSNGATATLIGAYYFFIGSTNIRIANISNISDTTITAQFYDSDGSSSTLIITDIFVI